MNNAAAPKRIRWAKQHYACYLEICTAEHDATYIREDLATCTPEERAVIEAAIAWFNSDDDEWRIPPALAALEEKVNTLLAARAKAEVSG